MLYSQGFSGGLGERIRIFHLSKIAEKQVQKSAYLQGFSGSLVKSNETEIKGKKFSLGEKLGEKSQSVVAFHERLFIPKKR